MCGKLAVSHCEECLRQSTGDFAPFCSVCGGRWDTSACENGFPCYFASVYEGYAKEFLLNLKYRNYRSLGVPMGRLMGEKFLHRDAGLILPIPLHNDSSRFFNQSKLLAEGISQIWNLPVGDELFWAHNLGRQVEKTAADRKGLPLSAINCHPLRGKRVLLVDDVYTTGSTIRVASEAVKRAGGEVSGACFWCKTARHGNNREFDDVLDALSLEII